MKSYKFFILFILFLTQLVGCAPSTILAIPTSITDRRTTEVQIADNKIFLAAWNPIQEITENEKQKSHFNIVVYNKAVLIVGEVPTEEVKNKITEADKDRSDRLEEAKKIIEEKIKEEEKIRLKEEEKIRLKEEEERKKKAEETRKIQIEEVRRSEEIEKESLIKIEERMSSSSPEQEKKDQN